MALWQFITFAILIGALLMYAGIIARRLALADARLTRIEEALLARSQSIDSGDTVAAEAQPEVSAGKEARGPYLTLRDLRARSEELSSRARREALDAQEEESGSAESSDALAGSNESLSLPVLEPVSEDTAGASLEIPDVPTPSSDPLSPPSMEPVSEESAATILENPEALAASSEEQSPPAHDAPSDDALPEKNSDTVLLLRNQRRRRRKRLGF